MNFLNHVFVLGHQNLILRSLMSVFKHQNFIFVVPRQMVMVEIGLMVEIIMVQAVHHALKVYQDLVRL